MNLLVPRNVVVFAGLLAAPLSTAIERPIVKAPPKTSDNRLKQLEIFFAEHDCPLRKHAQDFIAAADQNDLDWRLLPSISFIESSGGKDYRNNNPFGWASCEQKFPSIRAGIHAVASRLANSPLYRDKDLNGILATYNPSPRYGRQVKAVMRTLAAIRASAPDRLPN